MKIIFIDETDQQESATVRAFFSICGLIIDESKLLLVTNELEEIKTRYGLANLKDSRKKALDGQTKLALTSEISECLQRHEIIILAIILGDFSMSFELPKEDMYMGALSFLIERFTLSLIKEATVGLAVFDGMEKNLEKTLRKRFYEYVRKESVQMYWKKAPEGEVRDYVLPTLLFTDDEQSLLIQAVDLIAVSLNSAIVNTTKSTPRIDIANLPSGNKFLELYWPLFARSSGGKIEGWGIKVWN